MARTSPSSRSDRRQPAPVDPALTRNLAPREAAEYLGISPRQVLRLAAARELAHVRIGRRVVFRPADVERFCETHRLAELRTR